MRRAVRAAARHMILGSLKKKSEKGNDSAVLSSRQLMNLDGERRLDSPFKRIMSDEHDVRRR